MAMTPEIRAYTAAERSRCLAIFDSNVPESFTAPERPAFEAFLDDPPGPYFVVTDGSGSAIACGGYAVDPDTMQADLCWGMVRRDRQGEGLGRMLTRIRLDRIAADGKATEVALSTSHLTQAFYARLGFVLEDVVPDGIAAGQDLCRMRLQLRSKEARS